jgi:TolA-binding protein
MNKKIILSAVAATALLNASAQINSSAPDGYLFRGISMYNDENYVGCIDQLSKYKQVAAGEDADWYYALATLKTGDGEQARELFEQFLKQYPYSSHRMDAIMAIGDCAFVNNYSEALSIYNRVDPDCLPTQRRYEYFYRVGYSNMMLAEYDEALANFDKVDGCSDYVLSNAAKFYKAYIAFAQRDYPKAEQLFKQVDTTYEPGNMSDYYIAQIDFLKGDYTEALNAARRVLRSAPDSQFIPETNRIIGESLYQLGHENEAIKYIQRYVDAVDTPVPSALYILGLHQYQQGDYASAIKSLQPVTNDDSAMAQSAYLYIGQAFLKNQDYDAALLAFDKSLRMEHDANVQEAAFYNYAVAKMQGGKVPFGSSVSTFEEFLRRYPNSKYASQVQEYIVTGYITDNNYESALASINKIKNPSSTILSAKQRVLYTLGSRDIAAGNISQATSRLTAAKQLSSYNQEIAAETTLLLGECDYKNGNYSSAASNYAAYLNQASSNAANRSLARYDLGYARFGEKNFTDALTDFNRVVASPGNLSQVMVADAYNRIGDCYYYKSDFSSAATAYETAYKTDSNAGDYALYQQAIMKGYGKDYSSKISLLDKMIKEFPSSTLRPSAMLEKAETYVAQGNNSKAISTYQTLVDEYPNTTQGRNGSLQLALAYLNSGNKSKAIDTYKGVISKYPTSDEASLAATTLKSIYADDGNITDYINFINNVPGAPTIDPSEAETLAYESAEKAYNKGQGTDRLKKYINEYPQGSNVPSALSILASENYNKGNKTEALKYATTLAERYPDNKLTENALIIKAEIEMNQGKGEIALNTYRQLEKSSSSSRNTNTARMGILRISRDLSRWSDVITTADALLSSSTIGSDEKTEVVFSRGLAYSSKGNTAKATSDWSSIASLTDDLYGAKSAYYLAQMQYDNSNAKQARTTVEKLIASQTPHQYWLARGFILLSDIYRAEGKTFEANEYLTALKENSPGNESDIFKMIDQRLKK